MGTETPRPEGEDLPKTGQDPSRPLDQNVSDDNPTDDDDDTDEDEDETGKIELPGEGGQSEPRDPSRPDNP